MIDAAGTNHRLTANVFAIPFGMSGLAQAWGAADLLSLAPTWPRDTLWILAAAVWLGLVVGYTAQLRNGRTLAGELADQTYGPFVALAAIALMLFGGALAQHWLPVGRAVFIAGLVLTVLAGAWLTGQWVVTDTPLAAWHPGYFLPTAAGGLVASGTSAGLGYRTLAELMFGYGITCCVFLGAIILTRLLTQPPLPRALATTIAITVAPPAVAGAAWLGMNGGRVDGVALALAGSLVLFSAVQLRLIPVYRTVAFGPAWWSYSFAYSAAVVYTVRLLSAERWDGRDALIWALLALTTLGIGVLAVRTAWAAVHGRFLPAVATAGTQAAAASRESPGARAATEHVKVGDPR